MWHYSGRSLTTQFARLDAAQFKTAFEDAQKSNAALTKEAPQPAEPKKEETKEVVAESEEKVEAKTD